MDLRILWGCYGLVFRRLTSRHSILVHRLEAFKDQPALGGLDNPSSGLLHRSLQLVACTARWLHESRRRNVHLKMAAL